MMANGACAGILLAAAGLHGAFARPRARDVEVVQEPAGDLVRIQEIAEPYDEVIHHG